MRKAIIWSAIASVVTVSALTLMPNPWGLGEADSIYTFSNKITTINEQVVHTVDGSDTNAATVTPNGGVVSVSQGSDGQTYGTFVDIPQQYVDAQYFTYTNYGRWFNNAIGKATKLYERSGVLQANLYNWAGKSGMYRFDGNGNVYILYEGTYYYACALSEKVVLHDNANGDFAAGIGCLYECKLDDGTIFYAIMVDAKASGDTAGTGGWGQPGGNGGACYFESYMCNPNDVDLDSGTLPMLTAGNPIKDMQNHPLYQRKIVSIARGPSIIPADYNIKDYKGWGSIHQADIDSKYLIK